MSVSTLAVDNRVTADAMKTVADAHTTPTVTPVALTTDFDTAMTKVYDAIQSAAAQGKYEIFAVKIHDCNSTVANSVAADLTAQAYTDVAVTGNALDMGTSGLHQYRLVSCKWG